MNEIYFDGDELRNANNDSKEIESTFSEGVGEITSINNDINSFWTDENGKKMVEELAIQINDSKDFNENYTKYLQVMIDATETLGEKGNKIRLDLAKAKDISNAIEIVGDNIENVRNGLNSAVANAKEYAGQVSSIATNITKILYLLATIDKDITKIFADLAENENVVEPKLTNILSNMQVSNNDHTIDFSKVSTSIDNSKNGIFVNVNDKQRENYWKDCTLEETKESGIYRASKNGVILGFVQLTEAGYDYEYVKQTENKDETTEKVKNIVSKEEQLEVKNDVTVIDVSKTENKIKEEKQEKNTIKNQEKEKIKKEQVENKIKEESSNQKEKVEKIQNENTGRGSNVVNYAKQFIGNPYVYGGTSLTNGADCSGFVKGVYANYGVELPHHSTSMKNYGKKVNSLSEAQPGDIIVYKPNAEGNGHVAIYTGDNKIVHASSAKTGIIEGNNAAYREILDIRRIL